MDSFYLSALIREIEPAVLDRTVSRLSMSGAALVIDLRLTGGRHFLASLDRASPALYLSLTSVTRTPASTPFESTARKHLLGARVTAISKRPSDRIVDLTFERPDALDNTIRLSFELALTGRSANATLRSDDGTILGALFERSDEQSRDAVRPSADSVFAATLGESVDGAATQANLLNRFFGVGAPFGPQLKNEFLARCVVETSPASAFKSLVADLVERDPISLIYSRFPLDQLGERLIDLKSALLLSHIELVQARGLLRYQFSSLSEAADRYYSARAEAMALRVDYASLNQTLEREITRRESTLDAIESDRVRFADPERLKRSGDLILANLATSRIDGSTVTLVDYYDPDQKLVQIDVPEGMTLRKAAADYFNRYQKARRALDAIDTRSREVSRALEPLRQLRTRLDEAPTSDCIVEVRRATERLLGKKLGAKLATGKRSRDHRGSTLGRRFRSSDGYEIVVGRNDRDNDSLTFRVARPHDVWLHAADYPGSHAIVRNPKRDAVPHRTIAEAAALAAFYSQAKHEGKAAVHYTLKKFVSKPPRAKPGLVRLSSFKTILVEPAADLERIG